MHPRVRINGQPEASVAADDRGLCYGDGLFETIWWDAGCVPLWARHMHRLFDGCQRLQLPQPDPDQLWHEVRTVADGLSRAVTRITWTRGRGPRGYAIPKPTLPTCIVSAAALPPPPADWYHQGIRLHLCATRLGLQPVLAGLKHLARLEQVLARSEWHDQSVGEGLMLDSDDHVTSATAANVFVVRAGRLCTPALTRCGVAGTARAEILQRNDVRVGDLTLPELVQADEVFLTSAVRGIVPVRELAGHTWPVGPHTQALQRAWHQRGMPPGVAP